VWQNFGKQEIVNISGMPKFLFFGRLATISIGSFSKSCFTIPTTDNLKWDALEEI